MFRVPQVAKNQEPREKDESYQTKDDEHNAITRVIQGNARLRVSHEDVHAVLCVLLILPFGFEDELLEDVVVAGDDAAELESNR